MLQQPRGTHPITQGVLRGQAWWCHRPPVPTSHRPDVLTWPQLTARRLGNGSPVYPGRGNAVESQSIVSAMERHRTEGEGGGPVPRSGPHLCPMTSLSSLCLSQELCWGIGGGGGGPTKSPDPRHARLGIKPWLCPPCCLHGPFASGQVRTWMANSIHFHIASQISTPLTPLQFQTQKSNWLQLAPPRVGV